MCILLVYVHMNLTCSSLLPSGFRAFKVPCDCPISVFRRHHILIAMKLKVKIFGNIICMNFPQNCEENKEFPSKGINLLRTQRHHAAMRYVYFLISRKGASSCVSTAKSLALSPGYFFPSVGLSRSINSFFTRS